MVTRKFSKLLLIVLMAATVAGSAAAQDGGKGGRGPGGRGPGGMGGRGPGAMIEIVQGVTEATDLTAREVAEAMMSGQTVAEILTANGADPEAFVQDSLTEVRERLTQQVTAGTLTQAQADERLTQVEANLRAFVFEGTLPEGGQGEHGPRGRGRLAAAVAEATGLTVEEVRTEVDAGSTLADVLASHNITVETFIEEQLQPMQERLAEQVTNGAITQAIADARLELARVELTERLNGNLSMDKVDPADAAPVTTPEATAESQA